MDYKKELLHLLQSDENGKTPYQLAKALNISRQTVNKYIQDLEIEKKIMRIEIGHYKLYRVVQKKDNTLLDKLYVMLLSTLGKIQAIDPKINELVLTYIQLNKYDIVNSLAMRTQVKMPDLLKQEKTYENLLALLEGVRYLLYYFIPFRRSFKIDAMDTLDKIKPMSIELRIEDPGLILNQAGFHYYLIAILIQECLSLASHGNIYFRVSRPITDQMQHVYFELGYVDSYYQDFSITAHDENETTERELLDEIKEFYSTQIKLDIEEYEDGGKLHSKLLFYNNQDLEHLYELFAHTAEENEKIVKQLLSEAPYLLTRKWIPIEDWVKSPFAVIDCKANFGYIVLEHVRVSMEANKFVGFCTHFERIEDGWRINCMERVDFEQLFAPLTDWKKRYGIYAQITPDPEEFLKRRMDMIAKLKKEHDMKRFDIL